ncbi:hypothetical protein ACFQ60_48140 [Streptomyces zhihengii]|uniref:Uncharacterized protein n=1 Tax=Streptomyces zhihengii TaxID=1818004 RepID=A0ABS2V7S8_9ACTN|nr:hypothetical protein [Streptomyces zhihengii]MBM9624735.1 hypothetical protein [Streptomyces zhihengii]
MRHETTIDQLTQFAGLFTTIDHITVPETNPDTGITEEVTLPPPLIRRTQRRDDTIWWILTPPGIHERIFVADQAPITVYLKNTNPAPTTNSHHPPPQTTAPQTTWQQQTTAPHPPQQHPPAPQTPTPPRPAPPWTHHQP